MKRIWLQNYRCFHDKQEALLNRGEAMSGSSYETLYQSWAADMEAFWAERVRLLDWSRVPKRILDRDDPPFYRWFPDGELNTCFNCLDRHVEAGRGPQPALIL